MAGGATSVGRSARAEDVSAVAACLASAFFEDPVWGDWSFPDRSSRSQPLFELMASWARAAARYPWVRMTGDAEAVAVWIPPGQPEMTDDEVALFDALVSRLFGSRADELNALFELFEEHHPDEPHYYLSLWGTDRDHAGQGLGTRLIQECLARIDAERMPAYLESTNPANLPRYEALGFRPRSQFGPAGGPVITTMWREAVGLRE
jgi:GNAT superfamily N-acetyltransferase